MRLPPRSSGLISRRAAVILTIAFIVGAAAGVLTYCSARSPIHALLATGTAVGGTVGLLERLVREDASLASRRPADQHPCSCESDRPDVPDH